MSNDKLLNEVERQKKYLEELPEGFNFPLFNTKRALESQRQNGYRNTAVAAREIVDNAFEAGATEVEVVLENTTKGTRQIVTAVAFIDNGAGMIPTMARFALSWGGGTHFDDPDFIGKFGFGLPNASINQTKLVEVYTRTKKKEPVTKAWLNLDDYDNYTTQTIPPPSTGELPEFVKRHLKKQGKDFTQGTVVVWRNPDRLTYKVARTLAEHLIDDFGVTYRYLLDDRMLVVDGTRVEPVDPLFLDPRGRYFLKPEDGGAMEVANLTIAAKYFRDEKTGAYHFKKILDADKIADEDEVIITSGTMHVRVARLPYGFAVPAKDAPADAKSRFEIRQSRRGMSFVRSGREIETLDAFPRSKRDVANGLGDWPLLQGYAYHWGIEVKFGAEFDDVFGISNDKQRVRPIEDFWRLLVAEKVDRLASQEQAWQRTTRKKEHDDAVAKKAETSNTATPAEEAAAAVPIITGKRLNVPDRLKEGARKGADEEAKRRAEKTQEKFIEIRNALDQDAKRRPFRIDFFDETNGPFYQAGFLGLQLVVFINRQHPFYKICYGEILSLAGGFQAKQALDVLLITLAKAELEIDEETAAQQYRHLREQVWSPFLSHALHSLASKTQSPDEPEERGAEEAA
jgi:Histidine kinase-, DNA gyrase B-, and HSP90-like ATPase